MQQVLFIALGGACGAVARYTVTVACRAAFGDAFPIGTLIVNICGCFLIGLIATSQWIPEVHHPLIAVGFLGALTTFSTFGYETMTRVHAHQWGIAIINVGANLAVGLFAVWLGTMLGKHFGTS